MSHPGSDLSTIPKHQSPGPCFGSTSVVITQRLGQSCREGWAPPWCISTFSFGIIHITNTAVSHTEVAQGWFWSPRITVVAQGQCYLRDSSAEASICSMKKWTLLDIALRFQSVNYCGDMLKQREMAVTCKLLLVSILTHSYTLQCMCLVGKIIPHSSLGALLQVSPQNFGPLRHTKK